MKKPKIFMTEKEKEIARLEMEAKNKRLQQEQINKMRSFSNNLDKTCKEMNKAADDIFQKAKEASRQGQNGMAKKLLGSAARMQGFGSNLATFKLRVDCCITEMKAFSNLAAIPTLVKGINGFLDQCPNLAEIKYDMNNFGSMMKGMEDALFQLEDAMNFDTDEQYDDATAGNDSYAAIVSNLEERMIAELANENPSEAPMSGNSNSIGADAAVDADADAFAKMMLEESGN